MHPLLRELARARHVAAVSTLMPGGEPQTQLTWIDIDPDGEHLLVNSQPFRQRVRNLRVDPRLSVLIHDCADPWSWVEVRGRAVGIDFDERAVEHVHALSQHYVGRPYPDVGPLGRALIRIAVDKVVTPAEVRTVGDRYLKREPR